MKAKLKTFIYAERYFLFNSVCLFGALHFYGFNGLGAMGLILLLSGMFFKG